MAIALAVAALIVRLTDDSDHAPLTDQARAVIGSNYFKAVDDQQLEEASVNGMLRTLGRRYKDRFSHYFPPRDLASFQSATTGEFSGVGLTVNEVKKGLRVASVFPDTPAERAGIEEGDVIVAVDGKSIAGTSSEVSTALIKGKPGTQVKLRVQPRDGGSPAALTMKRASVRIPAADGRIVHSDGRDIGYVRYATFSNGAHAELRTAIEDVERKGADGLILDLRGNGGGLLNEAVLSSSLFVDHGDIVTTESRTMGTRVYDAVGDALPQVPTVVLINRDTASAAEIMTSALQDYGVATIVGTRSFGKGVFQEVFNLPAGGALDLTVGEYLTSKGVSLSGRGIQPDVEAEDDPDTSADEALRKAIDVLVPQLG